MPTITRIFIKTGLLYFVFSLVLGILIELGSLPLTGLMPLFWHTLMLGWITQIIMGISLWMFPGRIVEESFWNQKYSWLAFMSLNVGLILRIIFEQQVYNPEVHSWKFMLLISAVLHVIAALSYAIEIWSRVAAKRSMVNRKRTKS